MKCQPNVCKTVFTMESETNKFTLQRFKRRPFGKRTVLLATISKERRIVFSPTCGLLLICTVDDETAMQPLHGKLDVDVTLRNTWKISLSY